MEMNRSKLTFPGPVNSRVMKEMRKRPASSPPNSAAEACRARARPVSPCTRRVTSSATARCAWRAPGSARAVGRAMAKNPAPVIIPCHRVLAAGDRMGGFSAHGGTLTKQRMLALEHTILPL